MKNIPGDRRQNSGVCPDGLMMDRRKAYYHGKYNKQILSILLLVTVAALVVAQQGF